MLRFIVLTLSALTAAAAPVTIDSFRTGGGTATGALDSLLAPVQNYFAGYSSPSFPSERRNYFVFELGPVSGKPVASGSLVLYIPLFAPGVTTDPGSGYISPDASETYRISGTGVPADVILDPLTSTATAIGIFGTLGTGISFGEATVTPGMQGFDLSIPLTGAAIAAINANPAGTKFVIGGRLTTLEPGRLGVLDELVFSFSDIPGSGAIEKPRLVLVLGETRPTPVPEPAALPAMLAIGLWLGRRITRG